MSDHAQAPPSNTELVNEAADCVRAVLADDGLADTTASDVLGLALAALEIAARCNLDGEQE